jgi:hypothetical protein
MKRALTKSVLLLIVFAGFALPAGDIDRSRIPPMFAPGHGDYPLVGHERLAAWAGPVQRGV